MSHVDYPFGLFDAQDADEISRSAPAWRPGPLPILDGVGEIELDFETTGTEWWNGDRPIGVAVGWAGGTQYLSWGHRTPHPRHDEETVKRWFREQVKGKRVTNANTKFENHFAREWGFDFEAAGCVLSDVQHQAALLDDHRRKFSQEALCEEFLPGERKVVAVGGERLDPTRMAHYPPGFVAARAEADVRQVRLLKELFAPRLRAEGLMGVLALEDECTYATCEMEANAAVIDEEKLRRWAAEARRDFERAVMGVHSMTGLRFSPDKPDDWKRLLRERGLETAEVTATGKPSFTGAAIDAVIRASNDEAVILARRAARLADLLSKYLDKYVAAVEGGRLRFSLHQLRSDEGGTITGRFSASAPAGKKGFNPQQVIALEKQLADYGPDYIIRELFIAADRGEKIISSDGEQLEYRLFAHYANNPRVIRAYREDPRLSFHKLVHGMLLPYKPDLPYKSLKNLNFMCVEASTPILRADLRWIQAGELKEGEKIISFDEASHPGIGREKARRWRVAEVLANSIEERNCLEVTLDNGDVLVCTPDHRWIGYHASDTIPRWIRTDELRIGWHLAFIGKPWSRLETWESGWLGGFFDGEGCAQGAGTVLVAQNSGETLDFAKKLLEDIHPKIASYVVSPKAIQVHIGGSILNRLNFLGRIRPERLIKNFVRHLSGRMFQIASKPRVISIRAIGPKKIAALGTSSLTYIANGYAAHNTIYGGGIVKLALMMGYVTQNQADQLNRIQDYSTRANDPRLVKAKEVKAIYDRMLPEVRPLLKKVSGLAETRGWVRTFMGRRMRFPDRQRLHKALNGVIQGGAGDILKMKMIEVHKAAGTIGFTPRLSVHDQILGDGTGETAAELSRILDRQSYDFRVPILWDVKAKDNWALCDAKETPPRGFGDRTRGGL